MKKIICGGIGEKRRVMKISSLAGEEII